MYCACFSSGLLGGVFTRFKVQRVACLGRMILHLWACVSATLRLLWPHDFTLASHLSPLCPAHCGHSGHQTPQARNKHTRRRWADHGRDRRRACRTASACSHCSCLPELRRTRSRARAASCLIPVVPVCALRFRDARLRLAVPSSSPPLSPGTPGTGACLRALPSDSAAAGGGTGVFQLSPLAYVLAA